MGVSFALPKKCKYNIFIVCRQFIVIILLKLYTNIFCKEIKSLVS